MDEDPRARMAARSASMRNMFDDLVLQTSPLIGRVTPPGAVTNLGAIETPQLRDQHLDGRVVCTHALERAQIRGAVPAFQIWGKCGSSSAVRIVKTCVSIVEL